MQPIANASIARQGSAGLQCLQDDKWDQLFGKLIGTVIVGTVRNHDRQAIRVMVRPHEHVAGGFAGGVRRGWGVWSPLREITGGSKTAINFVGRDMEKTRAG